MGFKSVLSYSDGMEASRRRVSAAADLAAQLDAHLTVLAFGFEPDLSYADGLGGGAMALPPSNAEPDAEDAARIASEIISRAGVRGEAVPVVCVWNRFARTFGDAAQFSDLVVLGRPYGDAPGFTEADALEGALFDGDGAVLLIPDESEGLQAGSVLIAWNGSREALRAVRRAMPFLVAAERVEIAVFGPTPSEPMPGERLATMLSRHGVRPETVAQVPSEEGVTESLRRRVVESGAGLVVMGAYSHSRFREYVLGGVTREFLADFPVPVFTAH